MNLFMLVWSLFDTIIPSYPVLMHFLNVVIRRFYATFVSSIVLHSGSGLFAFQSHKGFGASLVFGSSGQMTGLRLPSNCSETGGSFRRIVRGGAESHQLSLLTNLLDTVILSNREDIWFFDLNGDGRFCVKDVRCLLDDVFLPKAEVNAMIAEMEAMDDPFEYADSLGCLKDSKRILGWKIMGLNQRIEDTGGDQNL
nr:RNA-directed DNA polymerase, eukaryota [Tanacetum cinerariifolium]